ncbi:MAG: DJ-1/PfpI family protein [Beijerinckiaceae bacterium]
MKKPANKSDNGHDMAKMPPEWIGSERIAMLIYPGFTALDMVGPHYMFTSLAGAKTYVIAKSRNPVRSDTGLTFIPDLTFAECPRDLDIFFVPGGANGTLAAMRDKATINFVREAGSSAKFVTSVCTGSLILAAADLLQGYRATSHWVARALLSEFGAIPATGRIVRDRNRITGAGVTAGVDFGLMLVGLLRGPEYAQGVQLLAEYAPEPPYSAGTPDSAPQATIQLLQSMFVDFRSQVQAIAKAKKR